MSAAYKEQAEEHRVWFREAELRPAAGAAE
jgi:hypothetical protein